MTGSGLVAAVAITAVALLDGAARRRRARTAASGIPAQASGSSIHAATMVTTPDATST
jgi:hypothetical protein